MANFGPVSLGANEGVTVVAALPKGAAEVAAPVLVERWSAARALSFTPVSLGLAIALLVVGGAAVTMLARRGRDEKEVSRLGRPTLASDGANEVVDWQAIRDMPPGLVGTLVDEHASAVDVTATIVDLAVRGHLRIEESPPADGSDNRDWRLIGLKRPRDDLLPYERLLLHILFQAGASVRLGELGQTFHPSLSGLRGQLYDEVVRRGWYRSRPDRTRRIWYGIGAIAVVMTAGICAALVAFTSYGVVGAALVLPALGLLAAAHTMPARTAAGVAALRQVLALRRYLETTHAQQSSWEESQRVFSQLLPYAMVFGKTTRWTTELNLASTGWRARTLVPDWYVGTHGAWNVADFGSSVSSFVASTGSALSPARYLSSSAEGASSGGGGVGSGGGGGGGRGW